jgi:hypothetical protein
VHEVLDRPPQCAIAHKANDDSTIKKNPGVFAPEDAQFLHLATGKAADAHFPPLQIVDGVDFLSKPASGSQYYPPETK